MVGRRSHTRRIAPFDDFLRQRYCLGQNPSPYMHAPHTPADHTGETNLGLKIVGFAVMFIIFTIGGISIAYEIANYR